MDPKDYKNSNIRKVSSDSENYSLSKDDVKIEESITPDSQSSNELGSGLITQLSKNPFKLRDRLGLIIQEKQAVNDAN